MIRAGIAALLLLPVLVGATAAEGTTTGSAPTGGLAGAAETARNPAAEPFTDIARRLGTADTPPLAHLAAVFDADPVAASDSLERDFGGRAACAAYAGAMIEAGMAGRLAAQLKAVLGAGDAAVPPEQALGVAAAQDGALWFPRAEEAGFFAGCVAAALPQDPNAAAALLAPGLALPPPFGAATTPEWLAVATTSLDGGRLSPPVRAAFDRGFRKGARTPD